MTKFGFGTELSFMLDTRYPFSYNNSNEMLYRFSVKLI